MTKKVLNWIIIMIALVCLLLAGEFYITPMNKNYQPIQRMNSMDSTTNMQTAAFAGGCFWGVEYAFQNVPGVLATKVGFMGGKIDNPSYKRVCAGDTYHAEVVYLEFDPQKVSYRKLVEYFFKIHDPTTSDRQGPDVGTQYRSAIFCTDQSQLLTAQDVKDQLEKQKVFKKPIVTQIVPAQTFWKAEDYHQKYFNNHPEKAVCHAFPKFE